MKESEAKLQLHINMADSETCSIRSIAPSYVSGIQAPSLRGSELPPYSSGGRAPPYSRGSDPNQTYTSLLAGGTDDNITPRHPPISELPRPASRHHIHHPPIALISPMPLTSQSRQYQAVAARRHAKSLRSDLVVSSIQPLQRREKRVGSLASSQDFSSLHPAPATPRAMVHSTAELFLFTCGRPNHQKLGQESLLVHDDTSTGGVRSGDEYLPTKKTKEDLMEEESKSWEFLYSQMAG